MSFYVKYEREGTLEVRPPVETLEAAEACIGRLRAGNADHPDMPPFENIEVLISLELADQTARAMAFTPRPLRVLGRAGYGRWDGEPAGAAG